MRDARARASRRGWPPSAASSRSASAPIRWIERTFAPIAAASGAKSSPFDEPPRIRCTGSSGIRLERRQRGGDVRRLRVVDVARRRRARRRARAGAARPGTCEAPRRSPRRRSPAARAAAVAAAAFSRLWRPRISGSAGSSSSAENSIPAGRASRHHLRARSLEDAQLRVAVRLERPVAVEVVRLEVQQHRHVAGELVHVLELERRELADDPVRGADRSERRADVSRDDDVAARRRGRSRRAARPSSSCRSCR